MRLLTSALCTLAAAGLLAGCSGAGSTSSSLPTVEKVNLIPAWMRPAGIAPLHLNARALKEKKSKSLIYADAYYGATLGGYPDPNKDNDPPTCTLGSSSNYLDYVNGFGTDPAGDTMIPALTPSGGGYFSINVFKPNCGALAWDETFSSGDPVDAATNAKSAVTGTVLVSLENSKGEGELVFCSQSGGCGTPFGSSSVTGYGGGVAIAKNGDCWLSAESASFSGFVLVYFKGCTGSGQAATGTSNKYYGGLFIDTKGNLGSIDLSGSLYVYSGCNPACTLLSSSTLEGESIFGGLDEKGVTFATGDYANSDVDVYSYSPSGVKYEYSFNSGMTPGDDQEAAHFAPRNKKL
jgi:hypothetical protein